MSQICGNDRRFSPTVRTPQRDTPICSGETDQRDIVPDSKLLRSHRTVQTNRVFSVSSVLYGFSVLK